jgi:hypothetical protein
MNIFLWYFIYYNLFITGTEILHKLMTMICTCMKRFNVWTCIYFCNYFLQHLDSWNFMQSKNAQIKIESRLLHRSTQEGPREIYFVFSWISYIFLWILELYMIFCEWFKWVLKGKGINQLWADFGPWASVVRVGSPMSATGRPRGQARAPWPSPGAKAARPARLRHCAVRALGVLLAHVAPRAAWSPAAHQGPWWHGTSGKTSRGSRGACRAWWRGLGPTGAAGRWWGGGVSSARGCSVAATVVRQISAKDGN